MSKKRMGIIAVVTLLVLISSNTCVAATKKKPKPAPAKTDAGLLQDNCRRECEDLFQKKYAVDNKLFPHIDKSFSYGHHYNLKMNKCFMLIIETGSNHSHKRMKLIDIRQKDTVYGTFSMMGKDLRLCSFLNKKCQTEEEWLSFIKPYMEE